MKLHSDARWSWGQVADGKKQEAAQAAFVPAALGIRGRAPGEAVLEVHNRGQGHSGSNLCTKRSRRKHFHFPRVSVWVEEGSRFPSNWIPFQTFCKTFFCRASADLSARAIFFFFPPHGVARSSCALTDLRQGAGRCRAGNSLTLGPASQPWAPRVPGRLAAGES